ncbi:MAG: MFS transporter, partial [Pseudomonadota bacterium]
ASGVWIGFIFASFSIAKFVVMPVAGKLSDQSGRKKYITSGLFLYSAVSFCFIFASTPWGLTLLRFGQGFAAAMILPIAQAYAAELAPQNREGRYMGLFTLAVFAGFGAGPLMGGFLKDCYGMNFSIYVLTGLTFFAGLMALFFLPDIAYEKKKQQLNLSSMFQILKSRAARSVIVFRSAIAMCRGAIIAFVPILAYNQLKLSTSQIGLIISATIILTAILQAPFGILADRVSRKKLILLGGVLVSGSIVTIPFLTTFTQLLTVSLLYGIFGALVLPAATAIMVGEGRKQGMGSAMSLFNMSMDFGLAAGPLIGGWAADAWGLQYVFILFSITGLLGTGFFILNFRNS